MEGEDGFRVFITDCRHVSPFWMNRAQTLGAVMCIRDDGGVLSAYEIGSDDEPLQVHDIILTYLEFLSLKDRVL
jgi:hypothetical protein